MQEPPPATRIAGVVPPLPCCAPTQFCCVQSDAPGALVVFGNTWQIAEPREDQRANAALRAIQARWDGNLVNRPSVSWYTPGVAAWRRAPFPADMR